MKSLFENIFLDTRYVFFESDNRLKFNIFVCKETN